MAIEVITKATGLTIAQVQQLQDGHDWAIASLWLQRGDRTYLW
jgi:hypothetical protein